MRLSCTLWHPKQSHFGKVKGLSFEERQQKREQQLESLQEALQVQE